MRPFVKLLWTIVIIIIIIIIICTVTSDLLTAAKAAI